MKKLIQMLFLILLATACGKDKPLVLKTPVPAAASKWELIPGNYKVYDTVGTFLYDLQIAHTTGTHPNGNRLDTLHYTNFDGNFNFSAIQSQGSIYPNNVTIGHHIQVHDSIDNRWNIYDLGTDEIYNVYRNDTIEFYFEKHNMPYWINDGTFYFYGRIKHIAVKQH